MFVVLFLMKELGDSINSTYVLEPEVYVDDSTEMLYKVQN